MADTRIPKRVRLPRIRQLCNAIFKECPNTLPLMNLNNPDRETIVCEPDLGITIYLLVGTHWIVCANGKPVLVTKNDQNVIDWMRTVSLLLPPATIEQIIPHVINVQGTVTGRLSWGAKVVRNGEGKYMT